jgi:hypothetical protein
MRGAFSGLKDQAQQSHNDKQSLNRKYRLPRCRTVMIRGIGLNSLIPGKRRHGIPTEIGQLTGNMNGLFFQPIKGFIPGVH